MRFHVDERPKHIKKTKQFKNISVYTWTRPQTKLKKTKSSYHVSFEFEGNFKFVIALRQFMVKMYLFM